MDVLNILFACRPERFADEEKETKEVENESQSDEEFVNPNHQWYDSDESN